MSHTINIRATKKEKAELRATAAALGMTLSEFLREAAMARAVQVMRDEESAALSSHKREAD